MYIWLPDTTEVALISHFSPLLHTRPTFPPSSLFLPSSLSLYLSVHHVLPCEKRRKNTTYLVASFFDSIRGCIHGVCVCYDLGRCAPHLPLPFPYPPFLSPLAQHAYSFLDIAVIAFSLFKRFYINLEVHQFLSLCSFFGLKPFFLLRGRGTINQNKQIRKQQQQQQKNIVTERKPWGEGTHSFPPSPFLCCLCVCGGAHCGRVWSSWGTEHRSHTHTHKSGGFKSPWRCHR